MDVFVGISGASGAPYSRGLVRALLAGGHEVGVSISSSGATVIGQELYGDLRMDREEVIDRFLADTGLEAKQLWDPNDYASPYASGSARWDAAVVCPCSMATIASLSAGGESNLIQRAASVALKEDRKLILVPRETPLSLIHLENLLRLGRAGAKIAPAMPAFYQLPESLDDMVDFMVGKLLNLLGLEQSLLEQWRNK